MITKIVYFGLGRAEKLGVVLFWVRKKYYILSIDLFPNFVCLLKEIIPN